MKIDIDGYAIRSFRVDDAAALAQHANNREIWLAMTDSFPHPYTLEDAKRWLALMIDQKPEKCFAIADEAGLIGGVGLTLGEDVYRTGGKLGYWLAEPYWGRGIATQVTLAMTRWGFETFGLERIEAEVFGWNAASARVLEKAGYVLESRQRNKLIKDGELLDALLYVRLRR